MIKILIGGSPCTHWSIAQKNNRETTAEGIGWELFKNYLIAKEKFKPDYFLYENNKSAAQPIKDQISKELGVPLQYINSALVSAQNRQRFYAHNIPCVELPKDRGILLRDILESGTAYQEKSYCLTASYDGAVAYNTLERGQRTMVAEPIRIGSIAKQNGEPSSTDSQSKRVYSSDGKSVCLQSGGGGIGARTGLYACPIDTPACLRYERTDYAKSIRKGYENGTINERMCNMREWHPRPDGKSNTVTTVLKDNMIIETANGDKNPIYEARNGLITIKGKQYHIKLADGYYIIRKLTVTECKRLQTVPDWYIMPCSASQNYKMLGNGWTVEVIKHILSHIPNIQNEEIQVLSMYDGMSCGQITLTELGCHISSYHATEIDKYAIQTTMENFPNTIQLGDAFQVREPNWKLPIGAM